MSAQRATAAVRAWASVLPHRRVAVRDLPELAEAGSDAEAAVALGIETVIDDARTHSAGLAASAAAACLARSGVGGDEVDLLLLCQSRAPERLMASEATFVQEQVGAGSAVAMTVGDLGCVAVSAALRLARDALRADRSARNVLVAMGSRPHGTRRYRPGVTIAGDGGAAALVSRGTSRRIADIEVETSGRYWDLFSVEYRDVPVAEWAETCADPRRYAFELAVESRNRLRAMAERILDRCGLGWGDVDHVVMQNLSQAAFSFYEEALGVEIAAACKENLRRYGHLGSGDIVRNLEVAEESGEIEAGQRVLVLNNSPVAAWSVMLYEP